MLVKAFLLRAIDTLSSSTRHCGTSPTYLSCDLAAPGYSKYHLSRYLQNLLFPPPGPLSKQEDERATQYRCVGTIPSSGDATLT